MSDANSILLDYDDAKINALLASVDYATLTEKSTPHDNDMILLSDSEADGAPKKAKIANLPGGGGGQCEILNWYMPTPVNQRSIVSGATISTPGYFLDGWKLVSGSCIWTVGQRLSIADESVVVQYTEIFYGGMLDKTYTFSIDTSDGIKSVTFKFPSAVSGATVYTETGITGYCTIKAGFEYRAGGEIICGATLYYVPYIEITATDDIELIPWLEQNSVSTMANATQPDFGEQLALCQRYLIKLPKYIVIFGSPSSADAVDLHLYLPVSMRITPSVVGSGLSTIGGVSGFTLGTATSPVNSSFCRLRATKTAHGLTGFQFAEVTDNATYLSAEM